MYRGKRSGLRGIRPGRRWGLRGLRTAVAGRWEAGEPVRPGVRRFGAGQRRQWPLLRAGAGSRLGDRPARAKDVRLKRRRLGLRPRRPVDAMLQWIKNRRGRSPGLRDTACTVVAARCGDDPRSEEHTPELQSLM